jgi:PHD/YefM family antitoxin component YafN of YafNO toxin-antitoxin module
MSAECFQTVDLTQFRRTLASLHQTVAGKKGRVEITRRGCDDVCVVISKSELECLERALEIFAQSQAFTEMHQQIAQIVAAMGPIVTSSASNTH